MKSNKKWLLALTGSGMLLGAAVVLPATASASLCQVEGNWGQKLYCGYTARGWGYSNNNAFGIPGMKGIYAYMGGAGASQVGAVGKNSSGSLLDGCKVIDTTNDGQSVVTAGYPCNSAVKMAVQINYY